MGLDGCTCINSFCTVVMQAWTSKVRVLLDVVHGVKVYNHDVKVWSAVP